MLQVERLDETPDVERFEAHVRDEPRDGFFGPGIFATKEHRWPPVFARKYRIFEVLEAVDPERLHHPCFGGEGLHHGSAGLLAFEPVSEPRTDRVGAVHQHLPGQRLGERWQDGCVGLERRGEEHDLRRRDRIEEGACGELGAPRESASDALGALLGLRQGDLVVALREPHGQRGADVPGANECEFHRFPQRPRVSMRRLAVSVPEKFCWPVMRLPSRMAKPRQSPACT